MFHPLDPMNNGGTQNDSAYRKGLFVKNTGHAHSVFCFYFGLEQFFEVSVNLSID